MPDRRRALVALAAVLGLGLVFAYYLWTATTNPHGFPNTMTATVPGAPESDYFNLQADAFRDGQVALPVVPHPDLLALPDPYDPARNHLAYRVHDLSLYEGRYYLYWGPTPVLTSFLPARLFLRNDLREAHAAVLYAFGGLLASIALFLYLARRFMPRARPWMLVLGAATLATANVVPYMLRRPTVYEVATAAAYMFTTLGVLLLVSGVLGSRIRWWRLVGGSSSIGLAAGARPSAILCGVVALAVLVMLARRPEFADRRAKALAALALLGPLVLSGALLLAYNQIRFDSPTEFGINYQMNDVQRTAGSPGLENLVPGLYYYVVAPPRLSVDFPFVHAPPPPRYPGTLPPGYNLQPTLGILTNVPIVLVGLLGIPVALRSRSRQRRRLGVVMAVVASAGIVLLAMNAGGLWGATFRYSVDFASFLIIPSLLAWLLLADSARSVARRRLAMAGGACLAAYGALIGIAVGFTGEFDSLRADQPATYDRLERAFTPVSVGLTAATGGPAITELLVPFPAGTEMRNRALVVQDDAEFAVTGEPFVVEVVSPGRRQAVLSATPRGGTPRAVVATDARGRRTRARVRGRRLEVPVELRRGINRIRLELSPGGQPVAISALRLASS